MASLEKKSFNSPDERRTPPNTTMEMVKFGDRMVARVTYHPGWRWTTDIKPVAGTDLCQINHFAYVISGRTHVVMADGPEMDFGPGGRRYHTRWTRRLGSGRRILGLYRLRWCGTSRVGRVRIG